MNKSILSREILTEAQQLRLDAVQVLCKWGSHTRVPPSVNLPIHAEVLLQLFHKKLEEVFDEKTFDASQPLYIQMVCIAYLTFVSNVVSYVKYSKNKTFYDLDGHNVFISYYYNIYNVAQACLSSCKIFHMSLNHCLGSISISGCA